MAAVEIPGVEETLENISDPSRKQFTDRVALCTAFFAVLLSVVSLIGNNTGQDMMLAQQQSSNQWAYYQAKVVREHLYKAEKQKIEAILAERGSSMNPHARDIYANNLKKYAAAEVRYAGEKHEIEQNASKLDKQRDIDLAKGPYFDYAQVLLEISIVMASISILSGSRKTFFMSIICAILGTLLCVNGCLMLVKLPFF